jgi:hypothetical protein
VVAPLRAETACHDHHDVPFAEATQRFFFSFLLLILKFILVDNQFADITNFLGSVSADMRRSPQRNSIVLFFIKSVCTHSPIYEGDDGDGYIAMQ